MDELSTRLYNTYSDRLTEKKISFSKTLDLNILLNSILNNKQSQLNIVLASLTAFAPLATLKRGYSITFDSKGKILKSVKKIKIKDKIEIQIADSKIEAEVISFKTISQ